MNLSVGIVGLPNVGKSTLFNALLKRQQAFVANYPFATIEPNIGVVPVPDSRLEVLAKITAREIASLSLAMTGELKLPPLKPAMVNFVDIAGLVKGASEGAGLGNKFLSYIREVSVIAHVLRAFEDENVIKEGSVDPKSDYKTIETELALADIQTISNIKNKISKTQSKNQKEVIDRLFEALNNGIAARDVQLSKEEQEEIKALSLLTSKPEIIVLNVSEADYTEEKIPAIIKTYSEILQNVTASEAWQSHNGIATDSSNPSNDNMIVISAQIESELASLSEEEQKEYLRDLGMEQSGLERLIQKAYETLGLISFLTAGEKEIRAWTIKKGSNAVEAAGGVHTDFIKKFIKAEVVSFEDYVALGGRKKAREVGKARLEGRDYVVKDGDVIEFKIGA